MQKQYREIESIAALEAQLPNLSHCVVQGVDLSQWEGDLATATVSGCVFLGCDFKALHYIGDLVKRGALVFPRIEGLPYEPYRNSLYTWQELMEGFQEEHDQSYDKAIFDHFQASGRNNPSIVEALARRIHDHSIDDALGDFLATDAPRRLVGIMGGHGTSRTDKYYKKVAQLAWHLTKSGYTVVTGGGPGIMEAGNIGAYVATWAGGELETAITMLKDAPTYSDPGYVSKARQVIERYPRGAESLAVPTWFYGHEPSNLFASHIAKYFSNSIREDGLLAIATSGIVFAPGSAGTTQEIFQDAAQNHYATFGCYSPMVFLGNQRYTSETGIYPLLERLAQGQRYRELLHLSEDPQEILSFILAHPPVPIAG